MTKILYVERNPVHRELTTNHLSRKGHQVNLALPAEFTSKIPDIPTFASPKELSDLVFAGNYDWLFLNRETFWDGNRYSDSQLLDYLKPVLDHGYQGRVLVDTTWPKLEVSQGLPNRSPKIKVLGKPYSFNELDKALETPLNPKL